MRKFCSILILISMILSIVLWSPLLSQAATVVKEESLVYMTTKDGVRYSMDGPVLRKDGKALADFRKLTFQDQQFNLDLETMKTLLVTDIAYDKSSGESVLFVVGLVFKNTQTALNDSSSFRDQKIRLGRPYFVLMSYLDGDASQVPWYSHPMMMEAVMPYDEVWEAVHVTDLPDTADPGLTSPVLYNFSSELVHPRIIMSKYYPGKAYFMFEEQHDRNVSKPHIKVFRFMTDRTLKPEQKFQEEFYVCFWWMEAEALRYDNRTWTMRKDRFYIKESAKDVINVYNFGEETSICFRVDIFRWKYPRLIDWYWRETSSFQDLGPQPSVEKFFLMR